MSPENSTESDVDAHLAALKTFHRSYTQRTGIIDSNLSDEDAAALLQPLKVSERDDLAEALSTVQRLLLPSASSSTAPPVPRKVELRNFQPGNLGWVVQKHGELYAKEYGWDVESEALAADIVAEFARSDPEWNRGWIAHVDGERVGSMFVVRLDETTAKFRLLLVAPAARGLGAGKILTDECLKFCRSKGFSKVRLWTHSCLVVARAIYAKRGFKIIESGEHEIFGQKNMVWENWELEL